MTRYLTLLTLSFLSTTSFVEAGAFNLEEVFKLSPEAAKRALTTRLKKLEENPSSRKNVGLADIGEYQRAREDKKSAIAIADMAFSEIVEPNDVAVLLQQSKDTYATAKSTIAQLRNLGLGKDLAPPVPSRAGASSSRVDEDLLVQNIIKAVGAQAITENIIDEGLTFDQSKREAFLQSHNLYPYLEKEEQQLIQDTLLGVNPEIFPTSEEERKLTRREGTEGPLNRASFYNVIGDGDCLAYTLGTPRDKLIEAILNAGRRDTVEGQIFRNILRSPIFLEKEEAAKIINSSPVNIADFEEFVNSFLIPKKYLPAEFAIAYFGHIKGQHVYIWDINPDEKKITYYMDGGRGGQNVHIGFIHGNHYQILVDDEAPDAPAQKALAQAKENRAREQLDILFRGGNIDENRLFLAPEEEQVVLQQAGIVGRNKIVPSSSSLLSSSSSVNPEDIRVPFNSSFKGASLSGAVPQGYTLVADPAQTRGTPEPLSVISKGEGHVALRGDGYVFYYKLPTEIMKGFDKKSFVFEVDVLSKTPGAYIQYWGYQNAASKKLQSTAHTGSGRWERLRLNFTVDGSASQFFLYPGIMPSVEPGRAVPEVEIREVSLKEIGPEQKLPLTPSLVELDQSLPLTFNSSFKGATSSGAVPQGYKLDADPAQTRGTQGPLSVISKGDGHVALTGDGYVFYYQLPQGEMARLAGQKVVFEVDLLSDTPGAYIQYWSYSSPNSPKLMSTRHNGDGRWQKLSLEFTVNGSDKMFFLYPAILPGVQAGSPKPVVEIKNVRLQKKL
ncbi:MAG: hypothetical protein K2P93_02320 [Alphaproteobacteria bacterium]|nr:hypothetical protein [Alphaproteobacteria bacterium]